MENTTAGEQKQEQKQNKNMTTRCTKKTCSVLCFFKICCYFVLNWVKNPLDSQSDSLQLTRAATRGTIKYGGFSGSQTQDIPCVRQIYNTSVMTATLWNCHTKEYLFINLYLADCQSKDEKKHIKFIQIKIWEKKDWTGLLLFFCLFGFFFSINPHHYVRNICRNHLVPLVLWGH